MTAATESKGAQATASKTSPRTITVNLTDDPSVCAQIEMQAGADDRPLSQWLLRFLRHHHKEQTLVTPK
jgi:hypothetical protein